MTIKLCSLCEVRPVGAMPKYGDVSHAKSMGYCTPCLTLAEMENTHSDYDHAGIAATPEGKIPTGWGRTPRAERADRLAHIASERESMKHCWVCHPELDATKIDYVPRQGTSRAGVVHAVPLREAGATKAKIVQEKLGESYTVRIKTVKRSDRVTLVAEGAGESIELIWDLQGRFVAGSYSVDLDPSGASRTRQVRNVSEAYRVLGVAK